MTSQPKPWRAQPLPDDEQADLRIDRVAVSLFIANYGEGGRLGAWVDQGEDTREHYRDLARAAISEVEGFVDERL